jgi:hypothetical protein
MAIHRSMIARMSQYHHRPHPTSSSSSSYAWYSNSNNNSNNNNHSNNNHNNTAIATTTATTTTTNTARLGMTLNLQMLHSFLISTVPQYSTDRIWIDAAITQYQQMATKMMNPQRKTLGTSSSFSSSSVSSSKSSSKSSSNLSTRSARPHHHRRSSSSSELDSHCREELLNCVTIITTFISSTVRRLPPLIIFEAHFLLGCIHATLLQYTLAHHSWVKALWMATANSSVTDAVVPTEWLALTLYCLGRNYSDMGQLGLAQKLLSNAEQYYTIALRVPRDHVVLVATRKLLNQQQPPPQPQQRIHEMTTTTTTSVLPKTIKSRRKQQQQQKGYLWSSSPSLGVRHFPGTQLFLIPEEEPTVGVGVSSRMIPTTTTPPYRRSSL